MKTRVVLATAFSLSLMPISGCLSPAVTKAPVPVAMSMLEGIDEVIVDQDSVPLQGQQVGYLRVHVQWPTLDTRNIQAFPVTTAKFRLTVTASDIPQPITATVSRTGGADSTTARITVPVGTYRTLKIEGLNSSDQVVASGTQSSLAVTAGQYTPVTVGLATVVGTITGTILNQDDGNALAGATVKLADANRSAVTDASGRYSIVDVPVGTRSLVVSKSGYRSTTSAETITVAADATASAATLAIGTSHWSRQLTGNTSQLNSVYFIDSLNGWAVGNAGIILHTTDGGVNWNEQNFNSYPTQISTGGVNSILRGRTLYDVHFIDNQTGWAVGNANYYYSGYSYWTYDFPVILKTSNGGATWSLASGLLVDRGSNSSFDDTCYDIFALNSSNLFTSGKTNSRFTNDGSSWSTNGAAMKLFFINSTKGWRADLTSGISYTNTGGSNWSPLPVPSDMGQIIDIRFTDEYTGRAVSQSGKILMTTDGGAHWDLGSSAPNGVSFNSFRWFDDNFGYGVCNNGVVYLTRNGGQYWIKQTLEDNSSTNLQGIYFATPDYGWAVGDGGKIYKY